MNVPRCIAGVFAGVGGMVAMYLGVEHGRQELITGGLLLITNMFTFFAGEVNGKRHAEE